MCKRSVHGMSSNGGAVSEDDEAKWHSIRPDSTFNRLNVRDDCECVWNAFSPLGSDYYLRGWSTNLSRETRMRWPRRRLVSTDAPVGRTVRMTQYTKLYAQLDSKTDLRNANLNYTRGWPRMKIRFLRLRIFAYCYERRQKTYPLSLIKGTPP